MPTHGQTTKAMIWMLIIVSVTFALIFGYKAFKSYMIGKYIAANQAPPVTVSTMKAEYSPWQPLIKAAGSLRAIKGVNVTSQYGGLVTDIYFTPGSIVKQGTLLVQLYNNDLVAQLNALEAQANLANITYHRDVGQLGVGGVSQAQVDTDLANLKNYRAQVVAQAAIIQKTMIHAPFTGKLGVSQVNPGQYINPGDTMVTLQALDPIWLDFYLPEQQLSKVAIGQAVAFTTDGLPGQTFTGKISTINPEIDTSTRNVEVEGTISNPKQVLLPGMFTQVEVTAGKPIDYLTLNQNAINYNPYGSLIYLVTQKGKDQAGKAIYVANQQFVKVGDTRGDQVAVLSGIKKGDIVVTAGQLKLKNGSVVIIDNSVQPTNQVNPQPVDS